MIGPHQYLSSKNLHNYVLYTPGGPDVVLQLQFNTSYLFNLLTRLDFMGNCNLPLQVRRYSTRVFSSTIIFQVELSLKTREAVDRNLSIFQHPCNLNIDFFPSYTIESQKKKMGAHFFRSTLYQLHYIKLLFLSYGVGQHFEPRK